MRSFWACLPTVMQKRSEARDVAEVACEVCALDEAMADCMLAHKSLPSSLFSHFLWLGHGDCLEKSIEAGGTLG